VRLLIIGSHATSKDLPPLVALKPDAIKRLPLFLKIALDSLGVLTVVLQFALVGRQMPL
jgi:hypothetical protein